jgi:ubiquinone biosynthesis protein
MQDRQTLLGAARRDIARLHKVSATIVRHGFGELLLKTPLGRRLYRDKQVEGATVQGSAAVRFTRMLASLGPTFIKLGQILSMRQDLLGREWIEALSTLQDDAPKVPFEDIRKAVETSLGMPLSEAFASFESEPLATASIAQTHLATTHEGERVVVKVQRPGIEDEMRGDLDLLYLGAQVLEASIDEMQLVGITDIVGEFERALLKELDFRSELANLLRMRSLLDPERAVQVPRPHPELSTSNVLTMEFFPGKTVRKLTPRSDEARHAVREIVHAACKQVFADGFFHGDPHSGNFLVNVP